MSTDFQEHQLDQFCWCRPHVEQMEEGFYGIYHRPRTLTYDYQPRARARLSEGLPA